MADNSRTSPLLSGFQINKGFLFWKLFTFTIIQRMDPVTHGLIGATASQTFASKTKIRAAALTGFLSAMVADLDVFIMNPVDPLLNLEMHRQFTHSLIFIPLGALLAALLVWWFVKKRLSFKETYLFALAGYATAGIADTFTSYGVKLLWPFVDERYAFNLISVFDPLFTLGILFTAGLVFYKKNRFLSWIAWSWITFYLIFGYGQYERAEIIAEKIAVQQNHVIRRMVVKPTIANQVLWSVRYETPSRLYAYGVRITPFSETIIYRGEAKAILNWQQEYAPYRGTTLYEDIRRFSKLSDGYLIRHPEQDNVIGDGRYSMLPTSVSPLWGIEIDTTNVNQHVKFNTYRDASSEVREQFMDMLLGRKLP